MQLGHPPHSPGVFSARSGDVASLADFIGMGDLESLTTSHGHSLIATGPSYTQAFSEVAIVVTRLQTMLQENETSIAEYEAALGDLEEKARVWARRAERAELERDSAVVKSEQAMRTTASVKQEVLPLVETFMEAEVLRSQQDAL
eukprot:6478825-Amphidinium_carterae.1